MDNYKKKYLLYKKKYLSLKSQKAGTYQIDIADIDELNVAQIINLDNKENLGQNNCGIIHMDKYIIKCIGKTNIIVDEDINYVEYIDRINYELDGYIPKFYKWKNGKLINYIQINNNNLSEPLYAECIIMEKLDGDLTNYILKRSYYKTYNNYDNYDFFYNRLPKTSIEYISKSEDSIENQNKFNEIMSHIRFNILELCICLNMQVLLLHHNLIEKGWRYEDLKLDNIGYKINSNNDIKLYFIDIESGLDEIKNKTFDNFLDLLFINIFLGNYSTLGQYNLGSLFNIDFTNFNNVKINIDIVENIKSTLLKKNYIFLEENKYYNWWKFIKSGSNHSFAIQYVQGFYRIVVFDDNNLHKSSNKYNSVLFPKIDKLLLSINDLYREIDLIYDI